MLRDYQIRALDAVEASSARKVLCVAPTGAGKTTVFCELIRKTPRALVLVHRRELVDQASKRLDSIGVPHGVILHGHPRVAPSCPTQVASVQTLARRLKPPADLVIVDEAHLARAASWVEILEAYSQARIVGFTATPWRLDGKGLGDLFERLYVIATPRDLVRDGWLAPVSGFGFDRPNLKGVQVRQGDYVESQLASVMSKPAIMGNAVEQWGKRAEGRSTIVFAVNVEHSKALCAQFKAAGVLSEHIDGAMSRTERAGVLARVASGQTTVVCSVNVLIEGIDIPRLKCAVLMRPTKSVALFIQSCGRIRRPWNDLVARVHDHAGNLQTHLLPDAPREYSLETSKPKPAGVDSLRTCKQCYAIYDPKEHGTCPCCGQVAPPAPRAMPETVEDADLVEFNGAEWKEVGPGAATRVVDDAARRELWYKLKRDAQTRGYQQGWAFHRYVQRTGASPNPAWDLPSSDVDLDFFENL